MADAPGLLDKLGVRAGMRTSVLRLDDSSFEEDLRARGADVSRRTRRRSDLLFALVKRRGDLADLPRLREAIAPAGSIWVLWPKGTKGINENDIRNEALARGLVDVKVVRFSDALSALKLVIRVADRR